MAHYRPLISLDVRKKELVGDFLSGGRESQPKGTPSAVFDPDFSTDAAGKVIPSGVYDLLRNEASVSLGWGHDSLLVAVASIRHLCHGSVAVPSGRASSSQSHTVFDVKPE